MKIDLSELKKQYAACPKDAQLAHTYGVALIQTQNKLDEGVKVLREALKLAPADGEIWNDLGLAYYGAARYDEAVKTYQEGLKSAPSNATHVNMLVNLGNALRFQNETPASLAYYEKALAVEPQNVNALVNYANALFFVQRNADALAQYKKVLALEPKHGVALLKIGEVQLANNDVDGAIKALLDATKQAPSARAYASLAEAYVASSKTDAALKAYAEARKLEPRNAELLAALGALQYEAGFLEDATKSLEESVAINPRAVTHNQLGIAYQVRDARRFGCLACARCCKDFVLVFGCCVCVRRLMCETFVVVRW